MSRTPKPSTKKNPYGWLCVLVIFEQAKSSKLMFMGSTVIIILDYDFEQGTFLKIWCHQQCARTNTLSSDQNVDIGGVVHCPSTPHVSTYVGLIHIIEDDNEYESFFIDPTSFWLSAVHYPALPNRGSIKMVGTSTYVLTRCLQYDYSNAFILCDKLTTTNIDKCVMY